MILCPSSGRGDSKNALTLSSKGVFWQRMRDSNPRKRSQSPVCYRYTNPLCHTEQLGLYQIFRKCQVLFSFFSIFFFTAFSIPQGPGSIRPLGNFSDVQLQNLGDLRGAFQQELFNFCFALNGQLQSSAGDLGGEALAGEQSLFPQYAGGGAAAGAAG